MPTRSARAVRVSVLMPAYNNARYLAESVRSVLRQDHPSFELLILDDGSSDGTWREARRFSDEPRVRLFRSRRNRGEARSRNFLRARARGRFLVNHDADDLMLPPDRLRRQEAALAKDPALGVVFGDSLVLDEGRRPWLGPSAIDLRGHDRYALPGAYHCSAMVRASAYRKAGPYDDRFAVGTDVDMWLRLTATTRCAYLPGATFAYRRHSTSLSLRRRRQVRASYERAFREAARRRLGARPRVRCYEAAGRRVQVRTDSVALARAFDRILAPEARRGRAELRFDICSSEGIGGLFRHVTFSPEKGGVSYHGPDARGTLYAMSPRYGLAMRVSRSERSALVFFDVRRKWERPDDLMEWTFMLPLAYLVRPMGWHFFHAASLVRGGRAVLLSGPSYSGKTTLALSCRRLGWKLLSDETSLLRFKNGRWSAYGFPRHVQLKPASLRNDPELRRRKDLAPGGDGRSILRIPAGDRARGPAELAGLVLLNYRPNAPFRWRRAGVQEAMRTLRPSSDLALRFGPEPRAEMDRLLAARHLASSGKVYRCDHSDADRARVIEMLERSVEEGR